MYKKEGLYNLDETGCFWLALPESGFGERGNAKVGKDASKDLP